MSLARLLALCLSLAAPSARAAGISASCSPDQVSVLCPQTIGAGSTTTWTGQNTFTSTVTTGGLVVTSSGGLVFQDGTVLFSTSVLAPSSKVWASSGTNADITDLKALATVESNVTHLASMTVTTVGGLQAGAGVGGGAATIQGGTGGTSGGAVTVQGGAETPADGLHNATGGNLTLQTQDADSGAGNVLIHAGKALGTSAPITPTDGNITLSLDDTPSVGATPGVITLNAQRSTISLTGYLTSAGSAAVAGAWTFTSSATVAASAFSVGGSTLSVAAGVVTSATMTVTGTFTVTGAGMSVAGPSTATYFYGNGSGLTNLTGAPPTGAAGGDLTGSYPNPTLKTSQPNVTAFTSPLTATSSLTVVGAAQFGVPAATFSATGALTGPSVTASTMTPDALYARASATVGSTLTVQGSAFSVGGSNLSVDANQFSTSKAATLSSSTTIKGTVGSVSLENQGDLRVAASAHTGITVDISADPAAGGTAYVFANNYTTAGNLQLSGGGKNSQLFLDKGGNVGIGTASPLAKLSVNGDSSLGIVTVTSFTAINQAVVNTGLSNYGSTVLIINGGNGASGAGQQYIDNRSGAYSFAVGAGLSQKNRLEFIPSTAGGGTTFTTPAISIGAANNDVNIIGPSTFGSSVTIPTGALFLGNGVPLKSTYSGQTVASAVNLVGTEGDFSYLKAVNNNGPDGVAIEAYNGSTLAFFQQGGAVSIPGALTAGSSMTVVGAAQFGVPASTFSSTGNLSMALNTKVTADSETTRGSLGVGIASPLASFTVQNDSSFLGPETHASSQTVLAAWKASSTTVTIDGNAGGLIISGSNVGTAITFSAEGTVSWQPGTAGTMAALTCYDSPAITVTGAVTGMTCSVGEFSNAGVTGVQQSCYVSSNGNVNARACCINGAAGTCATTSKTYTVRVTN